MRLNSHPMPRDSASTIAICVMRISRRLPGIADPGMCDPGGAGGGRFEAAADGVTDVPRRADQLHVQLRDDRELSRAVERDVALQIELPPRPRPAREHH